jgi:hypothetical protein
MLDKLYQLIFATKKTSARVDPCFGDHTAQTARDHLQKGDFESVEEIMHSISDVEHLDLVLAAASDWPGRPNWIEQWPNLRPNSRWARLVRGIHGTRWAWEARSGLLAVHVQEDAWPLFFQRLAGARDDLNAVDSAPLRQSITQARMIRVLMGLQMPEELMQQRFEAATLLAPYLRTAHFAYFTTICKKWGGSDERMFAFARDCAQRSSCHASLIAAAHIEAFMGIDDANVRARYFRDPLVTQEIVAAFEHFQGYQAQPGKMIGANFFAMALVFCNQLPLAKQAFAQTADFIAEVPWQYFGSAQRDYAKFRKIALR